MGAMLHRLYFQTSSLHKVHQFRSGFLLLIYRSVTPFHIVLLCLHEQSNDSSFTWGCMNKGKLKSRSILMQSQEKKSHNIAEVEVELNENRQQNLRNTTQTTSLQVKLR